MLGKSTQGGRLLAVVVSSRSSTRCTHDAGGTFTAGSVRLSQAGTLKFVQPEPLRPPRGSCRSFFLADWYSRRPIDACSRARGCFAISTAAARARSIPIALSTDSSGTSVVSASSRTAMAVPAKRDIGAVARAARQTLASTLPSASRTSSQHFDVDSPLWDWARFYQPFSRLSRSSVRF